ncbi:MAG: hypothetical protein J3R72DRAFT_528990 [Linnemannia gamsii]|nr:MAG: hypothetical protein J3R72DRAFT_528990 [Linnemannia gamsii]
MPKFLNINISRNLTKPFRSRPLIFSQHLLIFFQRLLIFFQHLLIFFQHLLMLSVDTVSGNVPLMLFLVLSIGGGDH